MRAGMDGERLHGWGNSLCVTISPALGSAGPHGKYPQGNEESESNGLLVLCRKEYEINKGKTPFLEQDRRTCCGGFEVQGPKARCDSREGRKEFGGLSL